MFLVSVVELRAECTDEKDGCQHSASPTAKHPKEQGRIDGESRCDYNELPTFDNQLQEDTA